MRNKILNTQLSIVDSLLLTAFVAIVLTWLIEENNHLVAENSLFESQQTMRTLQNEPTHTPSLIKFPSAVGDLFEVSTARPLQIQVWELAVNGDRLIGQVPVSSDAKTICLRTIGDELRIRVGTPSITAEKDFVFTTKAFTQMATERLLSGIPSTLLEYHLRGNVKYRVIITEE